MLLSDCVARCFIYVLLCELFAWRCVRYLCGLEGWALIVIFVGSCAIFTYTSTACILRSNVRSYFSHPRGANRRTRS